jgi:outer membrane protein assembly factor BamD
MRMNRCSFFPSQRAGMLAAFAVAAALAGAPSLLAQDAAAPAQQQTTATPAAQAPATASATLTNEKPKKKAKVAKADRIQQTKDTKLAEKREKKIDPLINKDEQLPDKQLYDKALAQEKSGHFDVARLDLQTLLNTYPDSQYQMRAKLAVADAWYKEGGTAALTQAEQEYSDFITFFPNVPEAAEAQMRIGDIYFKQLDVPDRDYSKAEKAEDAYRTMLKQYPDAPKEITAQAQQKLRETQELLASREAEIAAFYAGHANWPASIARYETLIDTYPQYSHMDDALIGLAPAPSCSKTSTARPPPRIARWCFITLPRPMLRTPRNGSPRWTCPSPHLPRRRSRPATPSKAAAPSTICASAWNCSCCASRTPSPPLR